MALPKRCSSCARAERPHTLPGLINGLAWTRSEGLIADMAIVDPTAGGNPVKLTKAALALLTTRSADV
jgi:hypothetical protein